MYGTGVRWLWAEVRRSDMAGAVDRTGRDAAARTSPWLAGRLIDERGRKANAHRLPIRLP